MSPVLSRFSFCVSAFCLALAFGAATPAAAKDFRDKYKPAELPGVTSYLVQAGLLPIATDDQAREFVLITECEIYKMIANSPFKLQEIKQTMQARLKNINTTNIKPMYVSVSSTFMVDGYNFDTQSITISPNSQIKNANIFDVVIPDASICGGQRLAQIRQFPNSYALKLNYPVSLLRIPMKKDIAESLLTNMDTLTDYRDVKIVYGTLYLQIEPVTPTIQRYRGLLHGQLDAIDLFLDQDRKLLFKRFNYAENY